MWNRIPTRCIRSNSITFSVDYVLRAVQLFGFDSTDSNKERHLMDSLSCQLCEHSTKKCNKTKKYAYYQIPLYCDLALVSILLKRCWSSCTGIPPPNRLIIPLGSIRRCLQWRSFFWDLPPVYKCQNPSSSTPWRFFNWALASCLCRF